MRRRLAVVVLGAALAIAATACEKPAPARATSPATAVPRATSPATAVTTTEVTTAEGATPAAPSTSGVAPSGPAADALALLPVKGRAPKTGYSRDAFGPAWADVDRNGCDTRNDILNRDLTQRAWRDGTHECVVVSGKLDEPYTGRPLTFTKAEASAVQIDHVVALGDAWQKGAAAWDDARRLLFANDPLNLLAVEGSANESKGDADAASWLPPNKAFRCTYVARQIAVKVKWSLWATPAEHDAMASVLAGCPGQPSALSEPAPLPASPAVPPSVTAPPVPAPVPAVPPTSTAPAAAPPTSTAPATGPYFANCAAARAAGAAPLRRGSPGYRSGLDRDGDGVACE